jgi:predicted RNA-binding protein with TRAM domain
MREEVVLARTDQGDGLTRVMVEYVIVIHNVPVGEVDQ